MKLSMIDLSAEKDKFFLENSGNNYLLGRYSYYTDEYDTNFIVLSHARGETSVYIAPPDVDTVDYRYSVGDGVVYFEN